MGRGRVVAGLARVGGTPTLLELVDEGAGEFGLDEGGIYCLGAVVGVSARGGAQGLEDVPVVGEEFIEDGFASAVGMALFGGHDGGGDEDAEIFHGRSVLFCACCARQNGRETKK